MNIFLAVGGVCMNESKCQLIYIAFWSRYCALFAQKLAYPTVDIENYAFFHS